VGDQAPLQLAFLNVLTEVEKVEDIGVLQRLAGKI